MYYIRSFLQKLLGYERSPYKFALACSWGTYIAFSPFPGLHTLMALGISWLLGLSPAITVGMAYFVNNPWTLVPVYGADYAFGYWLLHTVLQIPSFYLQFPGTAFLSTLWDTHLGIAQPCIWSFLIGGNILGVVAAVAIYPVMLRFFERYTPAPSSSPTT
jgi:uncharacterized protein (DUF2062 family)